MCYKASWLACVSGLAMAMAGAEARSQEEPATAYSVEELVAALTEQLTSIDSLYCEYTLAYGKSGKPVKNRFARSGNQWHWVELSTDEQGLKENTFCFDGKLVFGFVVLRKQQGTDEWSTVQLQDPRGQENVDPDALLGAKLLNIGRSVVDALGVVEVTKSEHTLRDGTYGIRLLARAVPKASPNPQALKYDLAVTLDPKHGFLPAEIRITESEENITVPGWRYHWKIHEFRRVSDEQTHEERWFPVSAVLAQGTGSSTITMNVAEVRVNPTLPPGLFRPDVPDGTQVADVTSDGRGQRFLKGGDFAVIERMQGLADASREALGSVRLWLLLTVLPVLALVVWIGWRKLHSKTC